MEQLVESRHVSQDEKYEKRLKVENAYMDDVAIKLGIFDQRCFYNAFAEFDD